MGVWESLPLPDSRSFSTHLTWLSLPILLAWPIVSVEMTRLKRRELTVDDLMRMQEGPRRKRIRLGDTDEEGLGVPDFSSGDEAEPNDRGRDEEHSRSGSEEGESDSGSRPADENDIAQHVAPPISINRDQEDEEVDSRFASSRISFKPRFTDPNTLRVPLRAKPLPTTFETMGISSVLVSALAKMSINAPTEIQAACILPLLEGEFEP